MYKVCLSGFEARDKTILTNFLVEMKSLGFTLSSGINFQVNVLVCRSAKQDKYKVAKRLDIDVVTKEWVYQCYQQKKILQTKEFLLKPFREISLALFGFNLNEEEKLKNFIIDNEGEILTNHQSADVIVFKKGSQYEFELKNLANKCIVDSDWIMQCYYRIQFVPTQYFEYNQLKPDPRELLNDIQGSKVHEALNKLEFNQYTYLQDCVIYIAIKDENLKRVIGQLISIGGGFYLHQHLPIITHIIYLNGCSEEIIQFGYKIVHPMWLCDSFLLRKKLKEEDYQVKIKTSTEQTIQNSFQNSQEDAQKDFFFFGKKPELQIFSEDNNSSKFGLRSHSFGNQNSNQLAFNRFSTQIIRKTKLFETCQIFVFEHSSLEKGIISSLSDNGALFEKLTYPLRIALHNLKLAKQKIVLIFLLPDHEKCRDTIQKIEKELKVTTQIRFYSYRWVKYCVEKNMLELQVSQKKLYHLQPTNQQIPTQFLKGKYIYATSKAVDQKIVLKELAKIVTDNECKFDITKLDYFVTDKTESKKLTQVIEANKGIRQVTNIEIMNLQWLLQEYINGHI